MPDPNDVNPNLLQMQAQMASWLQEAADYILNSRLEVPPEPSKNLIEGAEMIKAFNG